MGLPSETMKRWARIAALVPVLALVLTSGAKSILAYRPFNGTDAAVADLKETEIEFGPIGYQQDGQDKKVIAPAVIYNYGFAEGWEFVLLGQEEYPVSGMSRSSRLVENGVLLKRVLREGFLQDQTGPSVATEFGVLLPGINGEAGSGISAGGIVSQQWSLFTVHLNANISATRAGNADVFLGSIFEVQTARTVRPVAEVYYEHEYGVSETQSVLIGGIWQESRARAFDMALRTATVNGLHSIEFRAGVTFGFAS